MPSPCRESGATPERPSSWGGAASVGLRPTPSRLRRNGPPLRPPRGKPPFGPIPQPLPGGKGSWWLGDRRGGASGASSGPPTRPPRHAWVPGHGSGGLRGVRSGGGAGVGPAKVPPCDAALRGGEAVVRTQRRPERWRLAAFPPAGPPPAGHRGDLGGGQQADLVLRKRRSASGLAWGHRQEPQERPGARLRPPSRAARSVPHGPPWAPPYPADFRALSR